jgi:hypothetical protein
MGFISKKVASCLTIFSTANCQLPTANCQLPTANCQLPTANCLTFLRNHYQPRRFPHIIISKIIIAKNFLYLQTLVSKHFCKIA